MILFRVIKAGNHFKKKRRGSKGNNKIREGETEVEL